MSHDSGANRYEWFPVSCTACSCVNEGTAAPTGTPTASTGEIGRTEDNPESGSATASGLFVVIIVVVVAALLILLVVGQRRRRGRLAAASDQPWRSRSRKSQRTVNMTVNPLHGSVVVVGPAAASAAPPADPVMNATIPDGPAPATYSVFLDAETKTEAPAPYGVFLGAETKTETETETAPAVNAYRFPAGRPAEAVYYTEPTDSTAPGGSQQKHAIQREGVMYAVPSELLTTTVKQPLAGGTVGSATDQDGYEIPAAQKNNGKNDRHGEDRRDEGGRIPATATAQRAPLYDVSDYDGGVRRLPHTDTAGYLVPVGNPDAGIYAPVYNAPPGIKSVDLATTA